MKIHVRYQVTNGFKRYLLQRQDDKFWTGKKWTRNPRRAALFARLKDCHDEYHRLVPRPTTGKKRLFTAKFEVEVCGEAKFSVDDLRQFLLSQIQFTLGSPDGPVDGCHTTVHARFAGLVERTDRPG